MENPTTWDRATRLVHETIEADARNKALPPEERKYGFSLARQITHALEQEGLLSANADEPDRKPSKGHPETCWCHGTGWREELNAPCNLPPLDPETKPPFPDSPVNPHVNAPWEAP